MDIEIATVDLWHDRVAFTLTDGRRVDALYTDYPRLLHATPTQREQYELTPDRTGVHWPDVDEDISVRVLVGLPS